MRLLENLRAEHDLIEQVVGSLRTFAAAHARGATTDGEGARYLAFFRTFAGAFHHEREERVLFEALVEQVGLPRDRGPVAAITGQHRDMAALVDELAPLLVRPLASDAERDRAQDLARRYAAALTLHIDAEDSVLLPESEKRLRRAAVSDLPDRPPTAEEEAARAAGHDLLAKYPPIDDPALIRGEGCTPCPSFGVTCDGVERTWWNESEWEEFPDHL